jgi:hypothetical protein
MSRFPKLEPPLPSEFVAALDEFEEKRRKECLLLPESDWQNFIQRTGHNVRLITICFKKVLSEPGISASFLGSFIRRRIGKSKLPRGGLLSLLRQLPAVFNVEESDGVIKVYCLLVDKDGKEASELSPTPFPEKSKKSDHDDKTKLILKELEKLSVNDGPIHPASTLLAEIEAEMTSFLPVRMVELASQGKL